MLYYYLNLQRFGEGGDGGDGGDLSASAESVMGEDVPSEIPTRAKKFYQEAVRKTSTKAEQNPQPTEKSDSEMSYEDMIKSDKYKDQHKAYMDKTIGDRLKKYKGIESDYSKARATLDIVAQKYGVNPTDENFLEVLNEKIAADDSYYEEYAMEHDISTEDARKMVTMERKLQAIEAEKEAAQKQEQMNQKILHLQQNAEKTKAQFPEFNLEVELQDERFRRLCAVNNDDTTAAYMACHWNEIMSNTVQRVSRSAQIATSNAIASGTRPNESGLSNQTPSVTTTDFSKMNLSQLRDYAASQRKGRK